MQTAVLTADLVFPPQWCERYVAALRRQYPDSRLGVAGGWSSPKLDLPATPAFEAIERAMVTAIRRVDPSKATLYHLCHWINVLGSGDAIGRHDHAKSHLGGHNRWAAVFYVTGGRIVFYEDDGDTWRLDNRPGRLLIFPASLDHSVPTVQFGPRITVAFDMR